MIRIAGFAAMAMVMAATSALGQDDVPPVLTAEECARILEIEAAVPGANLAPGVDVRGQPVAGANLTPGVDVRGQPVVGANLAPAKPAAALPLPGEITVPIKVGIFELLGIPAPPGLGDLAANIGVLSIRLSDGQVMFNGQVLGATETSALRTACLAIATQAPPLPGVDR